MIDSGWMTSSPWSAPDAEWIYVRFRGGEYKYGRWIFFTRGPLKWIYGSDGEVYEFDRWASRRDGDRSATYRITSNYGRRR